tara:strand:+ start:255 stop:557 length:303 start_codon:yes stop_codon:yes gene_type:complete
MIAEKTNVSIYPFILDGTVTKTSSKEEVQALRNRLMLNEAVPSLELCLAMGIGKESNSYPSGWRGVEVLTYTGEVEITMANQSSWLAKGDRGRITLRRLS